MELKGSELLKSIITKALTSSTTALIPTEVDAAINDLAKKETPLLTIFQESPWDTNSYEWNDRSAYVAAAAYSESATFGDSASTYTRRTVAIKMIKADGTVSNLLKLASRNLVNATQIEIEAATQSLAQELERLYIVGNVGLTAAEFNGLSNLVTQTTDCEGACISFDCLDAAINQVIVGGGKPGLILLANRDLFHMYRLMRDKMVYNFETVEITAGVKLIAYRGVPMYGSAFVPTTRGTNPVNASAAGTDSLGFVCDLNSIVVPVLQPITYEDVVASTDSKAFRIKTYRALGVKGPAARHSKITNIGKPYGV